MKAETQSPFVVSHQGILFKIQYFADCEVHMFVDKDNKKNNWTEKHPVGTSK